MRPLGWWKRGVNSQLDFSQFSPPLFSYSQESLDCRWHPGDPRGSKKTTQRLAPGLRFSRQKSDNWEKETKQNTYVSSISAIFTSRPPGTLWADRAWWALDWFIRLRLDSKPVNEWQWSGGKYSEYLMRWVLKEWLWKSSDYGGKMIHYTILHLNAMHAFDCVFLTARYLILISEPTKTSK